MTFRIGAEARQVDDGEFGRKSGKLRLRGADQQRANEQRMPGELGEDAGLDPERRIGAAIEVLCEQRHALGSFKEVGIKRLELLGGDRLVAGPPHVLVGGGVANRELVLGAASGEFTGVRAQRAVGREYGLACRQRVLIKLRRAEVPMHPFKIFQAELVGPKGAVALARLLHEKLLLEPAYLDHANALSRASVTVLGC